MPKKSSPVLKKRISSWFSRVRKRVSSTFSPSSSQSPQSSRQRNGRPRSLDIPPRHADSDVSPEFTRPYHSVSNASRPFTMAPIPPHSSPFPPDLSSYQHSAVTGDDTGRLLPPDHRVDAEFHPTSSSHLHLGSSTSALPTPDAGRTGHITQPQDNFMKELMQETIIGAEFNSSAGEPPPRCHPGTRLAIVQRCLDFIIQCDDAGKLRWVVGPAGVGKSAVVQMVIEKAPGDVLFASVFLSVNGHRDGSKTIITIAYQLAVKSEPYRQFIQDQVTRDPSLLRKSLSEQFNKFIVEPFVLKHICGSSLRLLIAIDGLNECDNPLTQRKLLELISSFCITYPDSPIAWIVASRPEPHITRFFGLAEVQPAYYKEEMVVGSDEACEDVERYFRDELKKIKLAHPALKHEQEWPSEHDLTQIASSVGGLFAYAAAVVRYIGDPNRKDPPTQLRRVLETIQDTGATGHDATSDHPMVRLDGLYKRILSSVPDNVMVNARKLVLIYTRTLFDGVGFRGQCNALGLTEDDAYDALRYLSAVIRIPERNRADDSSLSYYHKSFEDFLFDFKRSGFSHNFMYEGLQLCHRTALKILEEVPYDAAGVAGGEGTGGDVNGSCDNISLSWPGDARFRMTDRDLRIKLYGNVLSWVCKYFNSIGIFYGRLSCFHALTTRFTVPDENFPFYRLRDCAFDEFRHELQRLGKIRKVPLRSFDYSAICGDVELLFTSPTGKNVKASDPWNSSCEHSKSRVGGLQQRRGWSTNFKRYHRDDSGSEDDHDADVPGFYAVTRQQAHENWCVSDRSSKHAAVACLYCSRRFARQFKDNPDKLVTVFVDSTGMCYVEFSLVDPDDEVSEWRYRFLHSGLGNSVDV